MLDSRQDQEAFLEKGRKIFAQECVFVAGANTVESLPPPSLVEVAFAGRSNVGKSSLINALTGRKTLARVSHTPGRTQQLNFFNLGEKIILVDLPGYGYAQVSRQKTALWSDLIQRYLKGRATLRRVCVLVDIRHGLKDVDQESMKALDQAAVPYQIILTKYDEIKETEAKKQTESIESTLKMHRAAFPKVHITSSHTGLGIPELRASLAALCNI